MVCAGWNLSIFLHALELSHRDWLAYEYASGARWARFANCSLVWCSWQCREGRCRLRIRMYDRLRRLGYQHMLLPSPRRAHSDWDADCWANTSIRTRLANCGRNGSRRPVCRPPSKRGRREAWRLRHDNSSRRCCSCTDDENLRYCDNSLNE